MVSTLLVHSVICLVVAAVKNDLDIHVERIRQLDEYSTKTREAAVEEYGTNLTQNRMIWEDYYVCLQKQIEAIGKKKVMVPESIAVLEGGIVHMDCRVCLYPGDDLKTADWYWYSIQVPMDEWTILDRKGRLSIYGVRQEEAGVYECHIGSTRSRPYLLHVYPDAEPVREVKPWTAKAPPHPAPAFNTSPSVRVFTHWNQWSECTRCDAVGRRYRFGACSVAHNSWDQSTEQTDFPILNLFAMGLPCWSTLLPKEIRENVKIKNRDNEIMTAFCKVPCTDEIFEVKSIFGKLLERVNNSAGLFSMLQGPPPLPPMPGRLTIYAPKGQALVLTCPGNGLSEQPYRWAVGRKARIAPWLARTKSMGRVTVNAKQQLIFSSVQQADERLYSCWQGQVLAGVVRLLVVDEGGFKVNHHIILFGAILILATFLYVSLRIFFNRKRAASIYY